MLENVTFESFAPAVGERFAVTDDDVTGVDLELVEATPDNPDAPAADGEGNRAPFSLLFGGPQEPVLPQRIYRLENDTLGVLEIFIVPVARDAAGTTYQAIFA